MGWQKWPYVFHTSQRSCEISWLYSQNCTTYLLHVKTATLDLVTITCHLDCSNSLLTTLPSFSLNPLQPFLATTEPTNLISRHYTPCSLYPSHNTEIAFSVSQASQPYFAVLQESFILSKSYLLREVLPNHVFLNHSAVLVSFTAIF